MSIKEVKNGWKIDVSRKGTRYRKLVTTSLEDAIQLEQKAIHALSNGLPTETLEVEQAVKTMFDLVSLAEKLIWGNCKSRSQVITAYQLLTLMDCHNISVQSFLTQNNANKLDLICQEKNHATATIHKYKCALKSLVNLAIQNGYIDSPITIKLTGKVRRRKEYLNKDQEFSMIKSLESLGFTESADLAKLAIDTGGRVSELLSITQQSFNGDTVTFRDTKNGEDRTIPLTNRAKNIIESRLDNQSLFDLTYEQLKYQWRVARTGLGFNDDYCFHVCRHTFATRLLQAGHPTPMVQLLTGHKNINSLTVYAHANTEHLKGMINSLN